MNDTKTIVFDLDGTLVDSARDLVPALNRTIAQDGLAPIAHNQVGHLVGKGAMAMIARAYELHDKTLGEDRHKQLLGVFLAEYEAHIADETVYFDGALQALDALADRGWLLAICTNKYEHLARRLIDQLGGGERFGAITGGDTFDVKKPDPKHIVETVRYAGGNPSSAIMVGDSHNDIDAAIAAGWPSIAVTFGYSDRPVETLGASAMINHFNALEEAVDSISQALSEAKLSKGQ
ncbi:MAG: HAD-IA family hydrolase [Ahrensia sp.]|nr:HAD-IA family hydrolase [Ahrensia sp.]